MPRACEIPGLPATFTVMLLSEQYCR
jgi:hypothetical protein